MRKVVEKRMRWRIACCGLGVLAVQIVLGVLVDQAFPDVRDPEYQSVERIVGARRTESWGRPLVLAFGTSRTMMGLDAGRVTQARSDGPLLVNAAFNGAGPMTDKVVLGRLIDAGIRPDFLFVEMMPMSLSAPEGRSLEERTMVPGRFTVAEAIGMSASADAKSRLWRTWALARLFPCGRHQAEFREWIGIDEPQPSGFAGRDPFGWSANPGSPPRDEAERRTSLMLASYRTALEAPKLSAGAMHGYRELFERAATRGIGVAVVCPPESSRFRNFDPVGAATLMTEVHRLVDEFRLPIVDARAWIADDAFSDGHHLTVDGARRYSERFAKEAMPLVSGPSATIAVPVSLVRP
jgi:hypothetical protein